MAPEETPNTYRHRSCKSLILTTDDLQEEARLSIPSHVRRIDTLHGGQGVHIRQDGADVGGFRPITKEVLHRLEERLLEDVDFCHGRSAKSGRVSERGRERERVLREGGREGRQRRETPKGMGRKDMGKERSIPFRLVKSMSCSCAERMPRLEDFSVGWERAASRSGS